jgi:hypothetical protein
MERQHRPPPLTLPSQPPAFLSALAFQTPAAAAASSPAWAANRRRTTIRRTFSLTNPAVIILIALFVFTGTLTWLLVHSSTTAAAFSSHLSALPNAFPPPNALSNAETDTTARADVSSVYRRPQQANETLNFQKVFAINLPSRLDRKDLLTVMAKYTNLTITIVPGVSSVAENSLPPPRTPGSLRPEEYRVWRAHANVWRRVIEEGLSTALILEDDNDWDKNLKQQVPRVMEALEEIRLLPRIDDGDGVVRGGPRVEEWDVLYLGSCWEVATLLDRLGRKTVVPITSDRENVASRNYNWVPNTHTLPPNRHLTSLIVAFLPSFVLWPMLTFI